MALAVHLQQKFVDFISSLFREGFLDDQFLVLQELKDERNPNFIFEIFSLFFDDSLINTLAAALQQKVVDFKEVNTHAHQFKGSCASVGAHRVKNACETLQIYCKENSLEGCLKCLQHVRHEYLLLKDKFKIVFKLEQEILAAGGTIPVIA